MMARSLVINDGAYPGDRTDGKLWYSLNVHWWDSCVVIGSVNGNPGGSEDIWSAGKDFAEAASNAIRHIESKGHRVDQVAVNV